MENVEAYVQRIVNKINDPALANHIKGWDKVLMFKFTDTGEEFTIKTGGGAGGSLIKGGVEKPDVLVTSTTDIFAGVMDKKINGMTAYMQRKIQTKGAMEDMMKMQKVFG